jgi:hypothetical protein
MWKADKIQKEIEPIIIWLHDSFTEAETSNSRGEYMDDKEPFLWGAKWCYQKRYVGCVVNTLLVF